MKYALGNMLNGAGGLNPDGLSLDLQFATDKTLTARKGPTPVLTRTNNVATFVGSNGLIQSAGTDIPRFDHDPVTLACRGLLIEEGRTNSLLHSANFKNTTSSYWDNLSTTTVTVDQTISPDGGVNADLLTTSATAFDCFTRRNNIYVGSTQYTYSVFLKQGPSSHRYVGLYIGVGISAVQFPFFDFNNPTVVQIPSGTLVGTINSTKVDAYPNGWYRVSVTFTTAVTPINVQSGVYIATSNGTLPAAPTAGLNAYIWGIQLELGAFATSYIPTTTSALARSADVCSITGANFTNLWNASEGTMLVNSFTPASGDRTVVSADDNTSNEMIRLRTEVTNPFFKVTDGGSELVAIDSGTVVANTAFKLAGAYKLNDFASSINGGVAVTDTTGTVPTVDRMRIGAGQGGNTMCGCVSSMRYYKKRLSDSKIQTLTV